MIKALNTYLNLSARVLLNELPFKTWLVEKSIDSDLDIPIIQYVFPANGMELRCDIDDTINTIFLYFEEFGGFDDGLSELSFSLGRQEVSLLLGTPSKCGAGVIDPVLGHYGPWDRFAKKDHSIHVEYAIHSDKIKKITLMRADVTP